MSEETKTGDDAAACCGIARLIPEGGVAFGAARLDSVSGASYGAVNVDVLPVTLTA